MAELQLSLCPEETEYLVGLLETRLKETRVEEHRTRTPTYRQHLLQDEDHIVSVLRKLGHPPA